MFQHLFTKFYAAPDSSAGVISPIAPTPKSTEDIVDLLNDESTDKIELKEASPENDKLDLTHKDDDDEDDEKKKGGDDETPIGDEDKKEKELEVSDEDEELKIDTAPRKQQLLKDYPDIFKKYPWFEKMMFRDKAFTELLGSLDDAKELKERSEVFDEFNTELLNGNTTEILKGVKEADQKSFDKLVDDYLPALARVDKEAYFHVTGSIVNRLISDLVKEADRTKNDELRQTALIINQFMFGSSEYKPTEPKFKQEKISDEKAQIENERISMLQDRFETSRNDLQTSIDNTLKNTISEYIDPREQMTSYIKKNAIADTLKDVQELIGNNKTLTDNLDKLWRQALDSKFDRNSLDAIKKFYLGAAKRLLPSSIKKIRVEALKDSQTRSRERNDEREETPRRGLITPGRPSSPQRSSSKMEKGESVTDFFARD